jgi:hypothetical protein
MEVSHMQIKLDSNWSRLSDIFSVYFTLLKKENAV